MVSSLLSYGRRNSLKISQDILKAALDGVKMTHIVYSANLNFKRCQKHLDYLLEKELITIEDWPKGIKIYRTTEKGKKLLRLLREVRAIFA